MNETIRTICTLLQNALFQKPLPEKWDHVDWQAVYQEVQDQIIYLFFEDVIFQVPVPERIRDKWNNKCLQEMRDNGRILHAQDQLTSLLNRKGYHYVFLKGYAASIYYPKPYQRAIGDIDLLPLREEVRPVLDTLISNGYTASGSLSDRDIPLDKEGTLIELHQSFALLNSAEQEKLLDQWIFDAIPKAQHLTIEESSFPVLPDQENGLVLLAHISQHLEEGLGIRQIIDWIMYVDKQLHDDHWEAFRGKTDLLGLTQLAIVAARLGQIYLGLDNTITWCKEADEQVCADLLEYLFECGNFGRKPGNNNTAIMVMSHSRGIKGFFRNLQQRGEANWKRLATMPWLKSFAWAYQLGRYVTLGIRSGALKNMRKNVSASNRRNRLMDQLGARRTAMRE